jgi:hypothetical protein
MRTELDRLYHDLQATDHPQKDKDLDKIVCELNVKDLRRRLGLTTALSQGKSLSKRAELISKYRDAMTWTGVLKDSAGKAVTEIKDNYDQALEEFRALIRRCNRRRVFFDKRVGIREIVGSYAKNNISRHGVCSFRVPYGFASFMHDDDCLEPDKEDLLNVAPEIRDWTYIIKLCGPGSGKSMLPSDIDVVLEEKRWFSSSLLECDKIRTDLYEALKLVYQEFGVYISNHTTEFDK